MLKDIAIEFYHGMLRFQCFFHIIPYQWDPIKKRIRHAEKKDIFCYRTHIFYMLCMAVFATARLIQSLKTRNPMDHLMESILNCIWCGAYMFTLIMYVQFDVLREELLVFTNTILLQLEENSESGYNDRETAKLRKSWSRQAVIGILLWMTNPAVHAVVVAAAPCAPQFLTSIYYDCSIPSLVPKGITMERIPFIVQEYYEMTLKLSTWSFSWTVIFMGLTWTITELKRLMDEPNQQAYSTLMRYRVATMCMKELNRSVILYLIAFPSVIFLVLALLLFGCIRLWHLDFRTNLLFPLCSSRCGFEVVTPLRLAGHANSLSKQIKKDWKSWRGNKFVEKFKRSCPPIKCEAGSMYTFEHSILPVSLNNLNHLLFSLLTGLKH